MPEENESLLSYIFQALKQLGVHVKTSPRYLLILRYYELAKLEICIDILALMATQIFLLEINHSASSTSS
jgi:hypothetical protein